MKTEIYMPGKDGEPSKQELNLNRHQRRTLVGAIKRAKRQAARKKARQARG